MYVIILGYKEGTVDIQYLNDKLVDEKGVEDILSEEGYRLSGIEWMEVKKNNLKLLGMQIFQNI